MARTDTLGNCFTDIANAIREKKGTTEKIPVSNFDTEIASIETGGSTMSKGLVINACNDKGYPTEVSIVGLTSIPAYYMYTTTTSYTTWDSYIEKFTLPSELTSIGALAFYGFKNLAVTELPNGIKTIEKQAFQGCSNLKITEIPQGVTKINNGVFNNCSNLTELTIKGDIASIGTTVFWGCSALNKIAFPNVTSVPTLSNANSFNSTLIASGTGYIYVPDDLVESFKTATNWSTFANQIKGISELGGE